MAAITLSELDEYIFTKIFETTFPVGTIFQTIITGNPNTIIPGGTNSEWEQIADRVLIGAGNTYPVESIGGEATHTLTQNEIPAHTHTRGTMNITGVVNSPAETYYGSPSGAFYLNGTGASVGGHEFNVTKLGFDASRSWTGETSSVGGNQPHNNIPPYYAVYIWKRIA